jgi:type I restriction-modification system DNA methylase subunit
MAKTAINRKKAAKEFAEKWRGKGYEKGESQVFWIELLLNVFGVENISDFIIFEDKVHLDHTSFIDAYIPSTHVMIEQKSIDKDLLKPIKQSDGSLLTPFQQAKRYSSELPYSSRPRWIITCNFQEFLIYDMEKPQGEPLQVLLEDLPDKFGCLQFMIDTKKTSISPEEQISLKAGELVGKLYDALIKEYINPNENSFRSLNILCVRIVFCLYAEDAGLFETRTSFEDYINSFSLENLRRGLIDLFKILNTKPENRDKYDTKINSFPYINGGLFADDTIEIPNFTKEIVDILVNYCAPFDWSEISPTIFGAVFESTLNPETRRKGGMHYTSIANIHKVIDPLFLDDLRHEFSSIVGTRAACPQKNSAREPRALRQKLEQFRNKIASLKFLDPACGSGNFLTETYISLRRLENEILKKIHGNQQLLGSDFSPIKVKISQFYGIEINDFAVTVAKTALWIAESQMMKETEEIVEEDLDFLPLSTSATIVEGNALHMDWSTLEEEKNEKLVYADKLNVYKVGEKAWEDGVHEPEIPYGAHFKELNVATKEITEKKFPEKNSSKSVIYDYIIGNPPFVGARWMDKRQKEDVIYTFGKDWSGAGDLDYVCCWYKKAFDTIKSAETRCAFVSTNSVTQGSSVANLWKPLFADGMHFDFAWRTFKWANETSDKKNMAAVHCVIIGFSATESSKPKIIFVNEDEKIEAKNINGYLLDMPDIFIGSRQHPLCDVPEIGIGNKPIDGGFYLFAEREMQEFIKKEPESSQYFHEWIGSDEFINGNRRYCLWLGDLSPAELLKMPECMKRVKTVRDYRLKSSSAPTIKLAEKPTRFHVENFPKGNYIVVPEVSSEKRNYVPIGFLTPDIFCSNLVKIIPDATLYHFGILTSSVHNAWMRAVCGRLESRYRYSKDIVYNNFPWSNPTDTQKTKIEQTAQAILDARAKYADCTLAQLYGENAYLFPELVKAHKENDKAVMAAYGFSQKMSEAEIVAELFRMYEKLTKKITGKR